MSEKAYPSELTDDSSHAHALALLERTGRGKGVVLDLGCGNSPVAEPLTALGFIYVGTDVDKGSLARLSERGVEAHKLDLGLSKNRLVAKIDEMLAGRALAAVFALDVLEHLVDPRAVVDAIARVARRHDDVQLVVSIPNVTHVDVATRLLLGRWDMTDTGLLDDTHLRFFSEAAFDDLFEGTGWCQVDAYDTVAPFSDQYLLQRSPGLQPGAGLGNLLRRVREEAAPHATTYQFIRRFSLTATPARPEPEPEPPAPFLSVVVSGAGGALAPLRADLAAQTDPDLELLDASPGAAGRNAAIEEARGSYLVFLEAHHRVGPRFAEAIRRGAGDRSNPVSTDCVVRLDAAALRADELAEGAAGSFEELTGGRPPVEPGGFDPIRSGAGGNTVLAAYAIPRSVCTTLGLRFLDAAGEGAAAPGDDEDLASLFIARAVELCSESAMGDLQVAVDEQSVRPADLDLPALREHLGSRAYVLPPGGLARAYQQRQVLDDLVRREQQLQAEVEDLRPRVEGAERERDVTRGELDALLASRTWRYAQVPRRIYVRMRSLMRGR